MRVLEVIGIGILILLAALVVIFTRRWLIARAGGTIGMNWRLSTLVAGRGWAHGLGRFSGDELRWYRIFSLAVRPRRVLTRQDLRVENRRAPQGPERLAMPEGWVVVQCRKGDTEIEFAIAEQALTGFLSWLEAAPPGALRRP